MIHKTLDDIFERVELAKTDSDFTYFFSLLLAAEALAKTLILGLVGGINEDKDRHKYRLEYQLVRSDGLGDWSRVFEDALSGPASQFLSSSAYSIQSELTRPAQKGEWQFEAVEELHDVLMSLNIETEDVPVKTDLKRWIRFLVQLRNKTRAHGATLTDAASKTASNFS